MSHNLLIVFAALFAGCFGNALIPRLPDHRIVGGRPVDISEQPHQVSLLSLYKPVCGASIISDRWLVTAAHCINNPKAYYAVSIGSTSQNGLKHSIVEIIKHPSYNPNTLDYDISLLQVKVPLQLSNLVQPIKLANYEPVPHSIVNITGWGKLNESGDASKILQVVSVPVVSRPDCQNAYELMGNVTERMICAGVEEGGKDACQGDSGGPLSANGTLYGVVSWGYGCARPKFPGVYTNIAYFRSWIHKMTGV